MIAFCECGREHRWGVNFPVMCPCGRVLEPQTTVEYRQKAIEYTTRLALISKQTGAVCLRGKE